jgi:hypothetical protein
MFLSVSIGWAVRNFFQTGIVEELKKHFHIVVLTTEGIWRKLESQGHSPGLTFIVLDQAYEPLRWRLFRQIKKKIYMESRKCSTEYLWEKYTKRPFYQKLGGKAIQALSRVISPTKLLNWIESVDFRINRNKAIAGLFDDHKPLFFFATHASSFFEELLLRSAVAKKTPAFFMVLSWDHLSSKIIMSRRYHTIFVWNEITKQEILQTYPSYREDQIKIVGAPQFDIYAEKPRLTYEEWCRSWRLDPARRTILYTTAPHVRHDQQHLIVQALLEQIVRGEKVPKDLQIFLKCHPFDQTPAYETFLGKYPIAVYRPSANVNEPQDNWVPSKEELDIARDCLYFCVMNMNIFSTVTLEAALLDKPIIHIAFDPLPVKNRIPCREYYNFDHFKRVVEMDTSIMVFGYDDLFQAINIYLQSPAYKAAQRKRLAKTFLSNRGQASSQLIRELRALRDSLMSESKPANE